MASPGKDGESGDEKLLVDAGLHRFNLSSGKHAGVYSSMVWPNVPACPASLPETCAQGSLDGRHTPARYSLTFVLSGLFEYNVRQFTMEAVVTITAGFRHANLVAHDWRELAWFYEEVLDYEVGG